VDLPPQVVPRGPKKAVSDRPITVSDRELTPQSRISARCAC